MSVGYCDLKVQINDYKEMITYVNQAEKLLYKHVAFDYHVNDVNSDNNEHKCVFLKNIQQLKQIFYSKIQIYSRVTVILNNSNDLRVLNDGRYCDFDLIALIPTEISSLKSCCIESNYDILCWDRFWDSSNKINGPKATFNLKDGLKQAIARGITLELVYNQIHQNKIPMLFTQLTQLIYKYPYIFKKKCGLILSSGATSPNHLFSITDLFALLNSFKIKRIAIKNILIERPIAILKGIKLRTNFTNSNSITAETKCFDSIEKNKINFALAFSNDNILESNKEIKFKRKIVSDDSKLSLNKKLKNVN